MKHCFLLLLLILGSWIDSSLQFQAGCPAVRLPNGRVRVRARGRIIRFNCYDGFTLVGNKYSTCVRGLWDTPTPVCVNSRCPQLTTPDHAMVGSKYNGAILIYFCEPGFTLIGAAEIYCDGRQWNGTAPQCRNTSLAPPTKCDFEKPDLCWWEQDPQHDFDWRRHNFETPSSHIGTGPTHDHTLGLGNEGYYLYIEASGRLVNDTARIVSPIYNSSLTDSGCFSFWYHMFGTTIGSLQIYFKPETDTSPQLMFHVDGNQGNKWLHGIFDLPKSDNNFQIIIEGVRGISYVSDIAVDDVALLVGEECTASKAVTNNSTVSEEDQVEIVNALQSCRGRCNKLTEYPTTNTPSLPDICHCTVDCADNSTCCPDYAEYCVLALTDGTTLMVQTTIPTPKESSDISPIDTESSASNHNVIPMNPKDDIDPNWLKPQKITTTTTRPKTTEKKKTTKVVPRTRVVITPVEPTEKYSMKETPYVPTITIRSITHEDQLVPGVAIQAHDAQKLHRSSGKLGLGGILGVVLCGLTATIIALTIALVVVRRRKTYKRGSNGSALSEDSDVRFLTSDEILDFNLARPGGDTEET